MRANAPSSVVAFPHGTLVVISVVSFSDDALANRHAVYVWSCLLTWPMYV
jgi:hypothetical protein